MRRGLPKLPTLIVAALLAALVLLLGLAAVSPALHARLHGGHPAEHAQDGHPALSSDMSGDGESHSHHAADTTPPTDRGDHVCAVTLFAGGLPLPLVFFLLLRGRISCADVAPGSTDEFVGELPPYWLVPSHAPPVA